MVNESAIKAVFEKSLKLQTGETCLIITDTLKESVARPFYDYASKVCSKCNIEIMEPLQENGQEPLENVAKMMQKFNVLLLITSKSLSHTLARRNATSKGVRIASMPGITLEAANRSLAIDFEKMKEETNELNEIICKAKNVKIITNKGTNLDMEFKGREVHHCHGIYCDKGAFGNLPEGEVCTAPRNANGIFVVDASFPGLGKLDSPLTFKVENGYAIEITGEKSKEVKKMLDKIGKKAYKIAELGIGTNPCAEVTGCILEDEKVSGTCHIALGNNISYGGNNDVPLHLDGVIHKPTIIVDGVMVMEKGKLLI